MSSRVQVGRTSPVRYRRAERDDLVFVVNSWVDSYRVSHVAGLIPNCTSHLEHKQPCNCWWNAVMHSSVFWVLARPGVEVWVAYKPGAERGVDLYGWLALERGTPVPVRQADGTERLEPTQQPLLHYIYIKDSFRGFGFAKGLLKAVGVDLDEPFLYTCKTGVCKKLNLSNGKWMPLLARFPRKE